MANSPQDSPSSRKSPSLTRRSFLGTTAGAAAALGTSGALHADHHKGGPLRFAQIGCGGKGSSDLSNTVSSGGKLIAMCDVDASRAKGHFAKYQDVPRYTDYREMLEKHADEIDAVVVSTPDHVHAVAALDAMKRGKHVYVQKPLARTYQRMSWLLSGCVQANTSVVTQMGNQGHSGSTASSSGLRKCMNENARLATFYERQRLVQSPDLAARHDGAAKSPHPIPEGVAWDEWVGPVASSVRSTAKLISRSNGAVGGISAPAPWATWPATTWTPPSGPAHLGLPTSIKAEASSPATIAYPKSSVITFRFPPNKVCPKGITMTWYDGGKKPKPPAGADPKLNVGGNGCLIVGSRMSAMGGSHAGRPKVVAMGDTFDADAIRKENDRWNEALKKLKGTNHHGEWVEAAKKGDVDAPGSNFEYAAPMSAALALGAVALRFPGQELKWDDRARKFTNHEAANKWITIDPRKGYSLEV